jgi:PST family polysaccharide transporter
VKVAAQAAASERSLGQLVASGLRWSFFRVAVGRAGSVLTGIVLARLLLPRDFGVFAVAQVVMYGLLSVNDSGVGVAIVRWQGDIRRLVPTVTTIAIGSSVLAYGACFIAAPWLSASMGAPAATGVVRLLCLCVVIDGITATPAALLQRAFLQDRRTVADLSNFGVGALVSIFLAAHGLGAWSLAWGRIVGNATSAILIFWLSPVRYRPGFDWRAARELIPFGLPLAGAGLLVFAVFNVDYAVVGSMLGPVALGFYVMAFNLSSWPVHALSMTVRNVSLPAFSRLLVDPPALRSSFERSLGWLMVATLPICVLLAVLSGPLVRFLYGDRWAPAAQVLQFLAFLGAFRVVFELVSDLLLAAGKSRSLLWVQAAWLAVLAPSLIVGARLAGIRGVGAGHLLVATIVVGPALWWQLHRFGITGQALTRVFLRPAVTAALIGVISVIVQVLVPGDFFQLAVAGVLALVVFSLLALPALWRSIPQAQPVPT